MKLAIDFSRLVQKSLAVLVITLVPESLSKDLSELLSSLLFEDELDESLLLLLSLEDTPPVVIFREANPERLTSK